MTSVIILLLIIFFVLKSKNSNSRNNKREDLGRQKKQDGIITPVLHPGIMTV